MLLTILFLRTDQDTSPWRISVNWSINFQTMQRVFSLLSVIQRWSVILATTHLTRVTSPHLGPRYRSTVYQPRLLQRFCAAHRHLLRLSLLRQCTWSNFYFLLYFYEDYLKTLKVLHSLTEIGYPTRGSFLDILKELRTRKIHSHWAPRFVQWDFPLLQWEWIFEVHIFIQGIKFSVT